MSGDPIWQAKGYLRHCQNEVDEAEKKLATARKAERRAADSVIAMLETRVECRSS